MTNKNESLHLMSPIAYIKFELHQVFCRLLTMSPCEVCETVLAFGGNTTARTQLGSHAADRQTSSESSSNNLFDKFL